MMDPNYPLGMGAMKTAKIARTRSIPIEKLAGFPRTWAPVFGQFTLELFSSPLPGGLTVPEEFGVDERQKRFVIQRNIFGGRRDTLNALWVVVSAVLLTKDSTNLPNQVSLVSQAAGFVRLIRQFAVHFLPLEEAGELLADQVEARFVSPHRRSGSCSG
jgi:hypothetical protein